MDFSSAPHPAPWRLLLGLLLIVLPLCLTPAGAQERGALVPGEGTLLRLDDVIAGVFEANPALQASRLGADALAHRRRQVATLPDPTVGVIYQPYPMLTAHGAQRSQWRVEQPIPFPGKLALQGDVAALSADIAAHESDVLAADLVLQACKAYYELYRLQQHLVLTRSFQQDLLVFEESAAVRYEVGTGMQQDVLMAQVEKNRVHQQLLELESRRRSALQSLARLMNRPDLAAATSVVVESPPPLPADDPADLVAGAVEDRSEAAALQAAAQRAERQVELARKAFYPDFGVSVTYFDIAPRDLPPTATGRDAMALGVTVRVPFYRGRLRAQLEEARLHREAVDARREELETSIETQVHDLLYTMEQEHRTLELYRTTLLPQATTAEEAVLSAYKTGRADFPGLLDARETVLALQRGYEDTRARYLTAAASLERALGGWTPVDLRADAPDQAGVNAAHRSPQPGTLRRP